MAATLTVSEIRQALMSACGQPGEGSASSAVLGTMFHQVIGELLKSESENNLEAILPQTDSELEAWKVHLQRQTYDRVLGPLLTRQAASLQSQGEKVLSLWKAVRNGCDFLAEVWWEITEQGKTPIDLERWLSSEQQIICELNSPKWREPVAILGQPDAVLKVPSNGHWCVLEWKLGRASPEVDLGQACLYHMILSRRSKASGHSALAVVNFRPEIEQKPFTSEQLNDAQEKLLDLIGRLAGVIDDTSGNDRNNQTRVTSESLSTRNIAAPNPKPSSPPSALLETGWIEVLGKKLLTVLREFKAPCRQIKQPVVGPTFVRFFLFPESRIPQKRVMAQADQLHLHLNLQSPPNMDVVDGAIAVDLPRPDRISIPYSKLVEQIPEPDTNLGCSKVPIGVGLDGQWQFCDLAAPESAHMLVVGTPGSGKSQWLRVAVSALIHSNTTETLQLLLIDPKQNAFTFAQGSPFLRRPIMTPNDEESVADVLGSLIAEMESRYHLFAKANAQSLNSYLMRGEAPLPRIVCVCDEYADLLNHAQTVGGKTARADIEKQFQRLAAMGRAAGIHLVLATQYPSRQILTSAIQASIGARVVLRVSNALESRVALTEHGAERLLGDGDLLYKCIGDPIRLLGAWLPEEEESSVLN